MRHPLSASLLAFVALTFGGPAVAASQPDEPSPIPAWAKPGPTGGSGTTGGSAPAAKAGDVNRRVFDTSDSRFDRSVDNQGWWATALEAQDSNDNYALGACREECVPRTRIRNFFSFDLSTLKARAVGATLVLRRYGGLGGFTETLGLFGVRTPAQRLNNNQGVDRRIYRDLGSGSGYGRYVLPTDINERKLVRLRLNGAAVAAVNAARGGFFSIGGKLRSIGKSTTDEYLFGNSSRRGVQRLVVYVEPSA